MTVPQAKGGTLAWVAWSLGAAAYCYGFFLRVSPSVMVADLMRDLAVGAAQLGHLSAIYYYAYGGLQLAVGALLDRFGARWPLALTCALAAVGAAIFAAAADIHVAYLGRLLIGVGAAFSFLGALKLAADWFAPRRFAMLAGCTLFLGLIGGVGGQAPLAALVETQGWRATMVVTAVVGIALAVAIAAIVRDRMLVPGGHGGGRSGVIVSLRFVFATPQSWVATVYCAAVGGSMLAFAGLWGVPYLMTAYGLDRPAAAATTTAMLIGWGLGAPLFGWISDRLRRRRTPLVVCSALALASLGAALYVPGLPLWLVQALLFVEGLASGTMTLSFAYAREHNPPELGSTVSGLINMVSIVGVAVLQQGIGVVLDLYWAGEMLAGARIYPSSAYAVAFLLVMAWLLAGLIAALFGRETYCRNLHTAVAA